ncbi:phoenix [Neoarius graeffei]|uniref:phoenix n=1 Tax=Neoarius graeffei TaxID=443677 RepID=UPI00298C7F3B|nr:phoenix [Neoarius graeffei]
MENILETSVQRDSEREVIIETPASDSDSGDSLFLTQSVTSASRTVKRRRPSNTPECRFSQELEDEREKDGSPNAQHEDTRSKSDSDSETNYADLAHRWKLLVKSDRLPHPRPRRQKAPRKRLVLPFLKSGSRQRSVYKRQTIANSEIGGFFKCMLKLKKGHGGKRRELSPSMLPSDSEQNDMDENEDDEDIRKVDTDCFIMSAHKRNRQTWIQSLKGKTRRAPKKCKEESKKCQEEQTKKCYQTRKVAKDLNKCQDDTDVHNESSSGHIKESQSRKKGEKRRKSPARCSPHSSLSDESPFVRSLYVDSQEEHSENQPQVLVTCSQSQSLDWHQGQKTRRACKNLMEPIDEMAVEETQWPNSADQDEDETQILEDSPTDRDRGEDARCLENIAFREHKVQNEDIHESVCHEPVENEDLGSGGFSGSQDLFLEPNNQATTPLKEIRVENDKEEGLESRVMRHDMSSVIKKKKRPSLTLEDVEGDNVKYSNSQTTQPSEIISPPAGDVCQERKDKKTSDDRTEHAYPLLPLENCTSGSRGNGYSSPRRDILMVRQEEKTETPLFSYSGLKFLKRKKSKKTEVSEISNNLGLIQVDSGRNAEPAAGFKDNVKKKKRKKDGLLEEPVDNLPENSVDADSSLSFQDSSVVCVLAGGSKPKKKRKKDKRGQPVAQEDEQIGVEEAIQIPCQGSASLVSIAEETEQLIRTDLSTPSKSHEVNQQLESSTKVTQHKELVQSDGPEPRRKKKRDSRPVLSDGMVIPQCSEESRLSNGTKTVMKKKQKAIDIEEGQVGEMAMASKNLREPLEKIPEIPAGIEIQPVKSVDLKMEDSVTPRKKKKKKRKWQELVREENVDMETTEQVETPDTTQDSAQQAVEVVPVRKKKKKKDRTETCQKEEASKNAAVSLGLGLCEMTTSNTPNSRCEIGGIGEPEGLGGSEPVKKKKKKKRKELENDGSWSVSGSHDAEETTVMKEASCSGRKLGEENSAPCIEMQLTNDASENKKHARTKGESSERIQQVLQSEDTIEPKEKKKKKRWVETDIDVYPEIIEHDVYQENSSPSKTSEAIIEKKKKKKKKKKDIIDPGETESLDVVPELNAAEEPRDVLVPCHVKEDSISSSGGELLTRMKKKKRVRDSDNDLETPVGTEQVTVSGESNQCSQPHHAKKKNKKKKNHL